jgi:hypothetical protein
MSFWTIYFIVGGLALLALVGFLIFRLMKRPDD